MSIIKTYDLFLNRGIAVAPRIHVNQNEEGEEWHFSLFTEDGIAFVPSSVSIIGKKADDIIFTDSGTVVDGKAVIVETAQMTAVSGKAVAELRVNNQHGTANFILDVEPSPTEGGIVSESDLSLIEQAISSAERIAQYGSPLKANSASDMTNQESVYVYTGTTTSSLTNGHWYYWDGSAWTDGGIYNAQGVNTDTTLSVANVPADSKAVGDRFALIYATDEDGDGNIILHLGGEENE